MHIGEGEMLQVYHLLGALIKEKYEVDPQRSVPARIFRAKLSPFSALVTYLHQQGTPEKVIAKHLKRNRTFVRKSLHDERLYADGVLLPLDIFSGELSVLESAAAYLKGKGMDRKAIATELGKSASVVWTLLKRAEEKEGRR